MVDGHEQYFRRPPPFDQEYTNGVGIWRQATNINDVSIPTEFYFTAFSPKSNAKTAADMMVSCTFLFKVTNAVSVPMPVIPPSLPAGRTMVIDRRSGIFGEGTHYLTKRGWFDRTIDPAELAASQTIKLKPGDPAPDFMVKTFDGKTIKFSDFRGKYVVLDFWATTCAPCVAETPNLQATFDAFGKNKWFDLISLSWILLRLNQKSL